MAVTLCVRQTETKPQIQNPWQNPNPVLMLGAAAVA